MKRTGPVGSRAAYRLLLEYEGTRYQGWQRQGDRQSAQGVRTIAGTLERVLHQAGFQVQALVGSGRTDAGVHALGQVSHLHLGGPEAPHPHILQRVLDEGLPSDIAVRSLTACSASFHARHDALERSYLYHISLRRSAFAKPFLWWIKGRLQVAALEEAWSHFQGAHDMTAFADLEPGEDPRCQIRACELVREGSLILLRVTARHFLRRQVRRMVGAAVLCGLGREKPDTIARNLANPSPHATLHWAEQAAPAAGLFLERVRYGNEPEDTGPKPLIIVP
jgi:tRNA pseudouridine38-40 synthase